MIVRDSYGLIIQHRKDDPSYQDGGDTAARTGIMSMCGSQIDSDNMLLFKNMVRHPYQDEWSDESKSSRDQLIQFCAGENCQSIAEKYKSKWFINKDFLDPAVRLYLHKRSGKKVPFHIKLFGFPFMLATLFWSTKIRPNEEINQALCMMIRMGPWWTRMFLAMHPGVFLNLREYWGKWRDQGEIGAHLWAKCFKELK
jgi:hypothetical protein